MGATAYDLRLLAETEWGGGEEVVEEEWWNDRKHYRRRGSM